MNTPVSIVNGAEITTSAHAAIVKKQYQVNDIAINALKSQGQEVRTDHRNFARR